MPFLISTASLCRMCTYRATFDLLHDSRFCYTCTLATLLLQQAQTGTGKSHTMEGKEEPAELRGIIPNTFDYIFQVIHQEGGRGS